MKWLQSQEARIPYLIFGDLCLPHFDGSRVIRYLRPQMVFVILSRRDRILDKLKGRHVGAKASLTKPFHKIL